MDGEVGVGWGVVGVVLVVWWVVGLVLLVVVVRVGVVVV